MLVKYFGDLINRQNLVLALDPKPGTATNCTIEEIDTSQEKEPVEDKDTPGESGPVEHKDNLEENETVGEKEIVGLSDIAEEKGEIEGKEGAKEKSTFSTAKLIRHLNCCDGMIAVLTRRDGGVSPYIMYEIQTCIKARKPLLVFVEDTLDEDVIPSRLLQQRFSRISYIQQVREHTQAIHTLSEFIGDDCPPRYQAFSKRRRCICIGLSELAPDVQEPLRRLIEEKDYGIKEVKDAGIFSDLSKMDTIDLLSSSDIALVIIREAEPITYYLLGLLEGLLVPSIYISLSDLSHYHGMVPDDFKIHQIREEKIAETITYIERHFSVFEQNFNELEDGHSFTEYVDRLSSAPKQTGFPGNNIAYYIDSRKQVRIEGEGRYYDGGHHQTTYKNVYNDMWRKANEEKPQDFSQIIKELTRMKIEYQIEGTAVPLLEEAISAARRNDGPEVVRALYELIQRNPGIKEAIRNNLRKGLSTARSQIGKDFAATAVLGGIAAIFKILLPI